MSDHSERETKGRNDPPADEIELLTEKQVARYLGLAPKTLRTWRCQGGKLPFTKLAGKSVRYRRKDVEAFIARGVRCSTSIGS